MWRPAKEGNRHFINKELSQVKRVIRQGINIEGEGGIIQIVVNQI